LLDELDPIQGGAVITKLDCSKLVHALNCTPFAGAKKARRGAGFFMQILGRIGWGD
jgi:hypothetical protein